MKNHIFLAPRERHHLGCRLFLRFLPDGGEDRRGGPGGAPDVRYPGSHQWHWGGSGTVLGMVNPPARQEIFF